MSYSLTAGVSGGKETLTARYDAPSGKQERDALVALWDVVMRFG